ncbi:heparan-sulfate 6-O-sulfotransferase 3-B-like [Haliotis asinina]|uniref:heparan-sulfate 6-O-sulfotransferase 3-B-like n=1 Tax=Haliotis asinina TaxID=109174 RepID=UPI0035318F14
MTASVITAFHISVVSVYDLGTQVKRSWSNIQRTNVQYSSQPGEHEAYNSTQPTRNDFQNQNLMRRFNISPSGSDVLVFIRIQKTGSSTLSFHLIKDIDISPWCKGDNNTSNNCYKLWRHNVLFQTHNTHWPCRLHADWTYLHDCAAWVMDLRHNRQTERRYMYITMVRDPLRRFISEWKHVARGTAWSQALVCNGHSATEKEVPRCYRGKNWAFVTLDDFMDCPSNLAINRQTRMLANLSVVGCYNASASGLSYDERHYRMLASAKENLRNMAYFGLTDYQELSQILFEHTFNLKFVTKFENSPSNQTHSGRHILRDVHREKIVYLNRFDFLLYQYAKDLFFQRLREQGLLANRFDRGN